MTGMPLAAHAAAAAAADAAIVAALPPLGRPRPGVVCVFDVVGVTHAFDSCTLEVGIAAGVVDATTGEGKIADEIEPKLVSDDEMGDR